MLTLLWLIPALPVAGFAVLALVGSRFPKRGVAAIGAGSIGASAIVSILVAARFLSSPPPGEAFTQTLWTWIGVGGFQPAIAFRLDALSLVMTLVVTFVSFLIHLYSTEFMAEDDGYSRFFAYMNLFVGSMVTLLLADNLLLLYLGWEGVGLCSYLLIGFWYRDPINGLAARKAFIVTRAGDTAMAVGLYLIYHGLGTLEIQEGMRRAATEWGPGSGYAIAAAFLLLGGAVGKSAQLPLQTWLPDAMAGPTPTSALIHAATMVTAGVYLIARTHALFELAPPALLAVAVVGLATLLLAGCSALTQRDFKRVLAYSTVSQIGYMFLALGGGAWSAAIFHFFTHAFFKALLFLAAGMVIQALHEEHDIFKMGGMRSRLPVAFWTFLIGGCSLAGLPLITAGFYSKGEIVWMAQAGEQGAPWLWIGAVLGVLLTSMYTFRVIFLVFFGEERTHVGRRPGTVMQLPAVVLAFFAIVGGFVNLPPARGFSSFLGTALPAAAERSAGAMSELLSETIVTLAFLAGLYVAYLFYLREPGRVESLLAAAPARALHRFWLLGWGFDWLYDTFLVRPLVWAARVGKDDFVDLVYSGLAAASRLGHRLLSLTQTGYVRWYAAGVALGTIVLLAIAMFL